MNKQKFAKYVKQRYEEDPNGRLGRDGKEYIQSGKFDIRVVMDNNSDLSWGESYLGTGFGSRVDYGETYKKLNSGKMEKDKLVQDVRERIGRYPRQINFVEKENREVKKVYTGVAVVVRGNGYAIYPDPEEAVEM